MEGLRKKLILVVILATASLVLQVWTYIFGINEFRADLKTLQEIHTFMENVLQLRRYEKNFAYEIEARDIDEVLEFAKAVEQGIVSVASSPVKDNYADELETFKNTLQRYNDLAVEAKDNQHIDLKMMRVFGHQMTNFAQHVLNENRNYITESLNKILIVPSVFMFLFGGILIVVLLLLTVATIKQIRFITQTTKRIAMGDFRPVDAWDSGYHTYPMIIQAFNRMIKELDFRQEQIIQSKKLAAIGTLTSGIAHEVNNPLNNISLTAETLLAEREGKYDEDEKEMLEDIISEVTRGSQVVNNLLDFSRSHGKMVFEPVDIAMVLETTLQLIRNQIMLSGVQLKIDFPEEERIAINGHVDSLKQVFINLCLNAIQAMEHGGLLTLAITSKDPNTVTVEVTDTGTGMEPEVLEKIFDPFFTTKSTGQGTGLGLSVVYGIVSKHKGYIEVASNAGYGTTFSVTFPRMPESE
ncbi:MAG: sensor histidine kinase [Desulforhopalus sp.]